MPYHLPAELNNEIVSYLWNDNHALKACALTSREMTHPSHKRLFYSVAICPRPGPNPLPETLYKHNPSNATIGTFSNFQQLLDGSPHIAEYIISLHLSDLSSSYRTQFDVEYPGIRLRRFVVLATWPRWLLTTMSLQRYLLLLRNLKALTIEYGGILFDGSCSTFSAILQQPSLLYIRILHAPCPIRAINDTVGPNVKHLISLFCRSGESSLTFPSEPPSSFVYLESLTIDYPSEFVTFIAKPTFRLQTSRLRRLIIDSRSFFDNHAATWTILQTCSNTLEELEFSPCNHSLLPHDEAEDDKPEPIDLSKLMSLKRFTVNLFSGYLDRTIMDSYRWLSRTLRTGNSRLEEVSINVTSECRPLPIDVMPWKDVCDILLSKGFQNMKHLNIFIGSSSQTEADMVVELLNAFEWIEKLRLCLDLNVSVKVLTDFLDRRSPDIRWETWNRDLW